MKYLHFRGSKWHGSYTFLYTLICPKFCCHGYLFLSPHLYKDVRRGSVQPPKDVAAQGGKEEINKKNDSGVGIVLYLDISSLFYLG